MQGDGLFDHRINLCFVTYIAVNIGCLQLLGQCLAVDIINIGNDYCRPFACKALCAGLANALSGPGDDTDFVAQAKCDSVVGEVCHFGLPL